MAVLRCRPSQVEVFAALTDPLVALADTKAVLARRTDASPILIVFTVAIAVLLALSVFMSVATFLYCQSKSGSFTWASVNKWRIWEVKVACTVPR